ncbi:hypothetical protein BN132_3134 [Cronobacter turicensis 564]|nr:hypothetical protein BN132_3134 [Cronobacter turicensis 564]
MERSVSKEKSQSVICKQTGTTTALAHGGSPFFDAITSPCLKDARAPNIVLF